MSKSNVAVLLLLRAVLVGAAMLGLFSTAQAQGRIGVTQSIQNNPLGKPPGGLDRVLRVGTDVQANEIISTAADDRAHLVFLDGTTLTIGPSSSMTIDKFVYDPTTQKGELAVNATKGVFRVIGGRISKTSAITVTTPAATMGIRGGIAVFGVQASATTSIFVYRNSMTVTYQGRPLATMQQVSNASTGPPSRPSPPSAGCRWRGSTGAKILRSRALPRRADTARDRSKRRLCQASLLNAGMPRPSLSIAHRKLGHCLRRAAKSVAER
jgi:hypothetical protein